MKGLLRLLLLLCIAMPAQAQYLEECRTVSGFTDDEFTFNSFRFNSTIRSNASGEFVLIGDAKLFRVSKEGVKQWDKALTAEVLDYGIDGSGNVAVLHNNGNKVSKYNSNGTVAWEKTLSSQSLNRMFVDDPGNVYVTGYDNNSGGLLLIKYSSNGSVAWQKIVANSLGNSVVANSSGDVFVFGYDFNTSGSVFVKYSSNGTFQWQKPINYGFSDRYIKLGPDGNIYGVLFDSFSTRVLKFNPSTGNTTGDALIDIGQTVIAFGSGNSVFVLGTDGDNGFGNQYLLYKLNSDFSGNMFTNFNQRFYFDFPPSKYRSVLVESTGTVVINFNQSLNGERGGVVVRMSSSGTFVDEKFLNVATTGMAIDYQGNYIFPTDYDCLKKLTPCEKLSVSVTSQPSSQTVCSGSNVQFAIGASGQGLLYQWKKGSQVLANNAKFSGVHTSTLTIQNANSAEDAGSYSCQVFDGCYHNVTSQNAVLSFVTTAVISTQPTNVSQCPATEAVFQISATGGQNVKYQWKKGASVLTESSVLVGTKTNKLTIKNIGVADGGQYTCEVTSDCFTAPIVSQQAILTILPATTLSTQPLPIAVCGGSTAVFTIAAGGTGLTYQWRKGGQNLVESAGVVGTKTTLLTIKGVKDTDAGAYSCVVTGTCGTPVTSSNAALTVTPASQITTQPLSKEICAGATTSFSVTVTGTGLGYSWRKGNTVLANGGKYSGTSTATLNIASVTASEEGQYSCVITSSCGGELISTVAQLLIGSAPTITGKSADVKICEGEVARMSVNVTGGLVKFQWKLNGSALSDANGILGSKARELFIESVKSSDAGVYTCDVSTDCGAVQVSGPIKLELSSELTIDPEITTQKECNGQKVSISATVSGTVQSYQWKKNGVNLSNNSSFSGVTTATLLIQKVASTDEGFYACEVRSACGNILLTSDIKLEVNNSPDLVLLDVDCNAFPDDWPSLVTDLNNIFGTYEIFAAGTTVPLPNINSATKAGLYEIVKSNGTCSDTVEWNNDCLITSAEKPADIFALTPNPSSGVFSVRNGVPFQRFEMYDSRGTVVLSDQLTQQIESTIDATRLSDGVYFLTFLTGDGKRISKRMVISR